MLQIKSIVFKVQEQSAGADMAFSFSGDSDLSGDVRQLFKCKP